MSDDDKIKLSAMELDEEKARELEEKFDSEIRFRPLTRVAGWLVGFLLVALSLFHYYTAGFGLLQEMLHRGIHLSMVLALIFLVFPLVKKRYDQPAQSSLLRPLGIPLFDWLLAIAAVVVVMHVPMIPLDDLAFRVGNPTALDVVFGLILILLLLEATRRSVGIPLPIIAVVFMAYALLGRYMPSILVHPGASVSQLVDHLYLTTQGIYGIALGVVATYVFHFVLFGVFATRIGLGQLFLDCAAWIAGRYAGGPAKVSIFGSALFGMISGSSVANTVTVGSLTIPAMIRLGYKKHFAAAVEAASSTGGQVTPPIMGAAAFLMIEFLELPYTTIILAAIVPAFMHFFGVFMQVHFEAKRTGLQRAQAGRDARRRRGAEAGLADDHPARRPHRRAALGLHALHGRLLGHHLVYSRRPAQSAPAHVGRRHRDVPARRRQICARSRSRRRNRRHRRRRRHADRRRLQAVLHRHIDGWTPFPSLRHLHPRGDLLGPRPDPAVHA